MKNQKQKEYETPQTTFVEVELEGRFCASADVQNPNNAENGQIKEHEVNQDFHFSFTDGNSWDSVDKI